MRAVGADPWMLERKPYGVSCAPWRTMATGVRTNGITKPMGPMVLPSASQSDTRPGSW
jgi:hypothetical protein